MFRSSKKENTGRVSPSSDRNRRQFYTYSSSNRYNNSRDAISKRDKPNARDRTNTISIDNESPSPVVSFLEKSTSYMIVILLVICAGYSTTLSSDSRLIINKDKALLLNRGTDEYAQTLKELLNKSVMNKNKITIDTVKISDELKNKYPEVTKVEVRLPLVGRRPVVNITTDEIALVVKVGKVTYGVGKSGKLLIQSKDQLEIDEDTPVVIDNSEVENKVGKNILTSQDVDFILNLIKQFKIKNIAIESITLPKLAAEIQVKPKGVNYIVKFNMLTDYKVTVGQYFSLKKKLDADGIVPAEYIDSRVEERIYYK